MCLTKICFNNEQEHLSQVFLIQLSVFQVACLFGSYISETDKFFFCLHEFWKLAQL